MKSFKTCLATLLAISTLALPAFAADAPLTEREKIIHTLNRLGFGARPGDVERVEKMGLQNYIQQQLHPERINDSAVEKKIETYETLKMDSQTLASDYYEGIKLQQERKKQADEAKQGNAPKPAPMPPAKMMEELGKRLAVRCVGELQTAKIVRAVESERQFQEVMVDFWSNHFNIDTKKGPGGVFKVADDRDVIRPHVFGKFRTLLGASAHSAAMMFYLDNQQNSVARDVTPMEQQMREKVMEQMTGLKNPDGSAPAEQKRRKEGGINENYARELMELHTLGVDGGYTQQDVIEVARCLTGWGIQPQQGKFAFGPRRHDNGEKTVLEQKIPAGGGMKDGETVLDMLAAHPSTAKYISKKLCQRLVCDEPPAALVDRVARVFTNTDGDLRKVYEAIVTSPEFFARENYQTKIKSPFEFAVSAARATGANLATELTAQEKARLTLEGAATLGRGAERAARAANKSLNYHIFEMGQPLFGYAAPTGYPEDSRKWVSSGALIARLNFALTFTNGQVANLSFDRGELMKGVDLNNSVDVMKRLSEIFLHGNMSDSTKKTLEKEMDGDSINPAKAAALVVGSPEFQRR